MTNQQTAAEQTPRSLWEATHAEYCALVNSLATMTQEQIEAAKPRIMELFDTLQAKPRLTTKMAKQGLRFDVYWHGGKTNVQIANRDGEWGALVCGSFTKCGTFKDALAIVEINLNRVERGN